MIDNPSHRVIELRYETGNDDGWAADGYYVLRSGSGEELGRGIFITDGDGRFVFDGWLERRPSLETPAEDAFDWVDE